MVEQQQQQKQQQQCKEEVPAAKTQGRGQRSEKPRAPRSEPWLEETAACERRRRGVGVCMDGHMQQAHTMQHVPL